MACFGWRSPFPMRLGGGGHERVQQVFNTLRANTGSALSHDPTAANVLEDMAAARLLGIAHQLIDRRVNQVDPALLTTMLERWEAILQITPADGATAWDRRRAIAARLKSVYGSSADKLAQLAEEAFYPWRIRLHFIGLDDALMYWPGAGNTTADLSWYSTTAHIVVEYIRPANAAQKDVDVRRQACLDALDTWAAAWATFALSETQEYGVNAEQYGFYLDQPNLDVSVFAE